MFLIKAKPCISSKRKFCISSVAKPLYLIKTIEVYTPTV